MRNLKKKKKSEKERKKRFSRPTASLRWAFFMARGNWRTGGLRCLGACRVQLEQLEAGMRPLRGRAATEALHGRLLAERYRMDECQRSPTARAHNSSSSGPAPTLYLSLYPTGVCADTANAQQRTCTTSRVFAAGAGEAPVQPGGRSVSALWLNAS